MGHRGDTLEQRRGGPVWQECISGFCEGACLGSFAQG